MENRERTSSETKDEHTTSECQRPDRNGCPRSGEFTSVPDVEDDGEWANDNECDDPRFEGEGMTSTPLLQEDVQRDATDCAISTNFGSAPCAMRTLPCAEQWEGTSNCDQSSKANGSGGMVQE